MSPSFDVSNALIVFRLGDSKKVGHMGQSQPSARFSGFGVFHRSSPARIFVAGQGHTLKLHLIFTVAYLAMLVSQTVTPEA